ncbi:unnamed protein product [Pedinophyceae sp. YPF-701]|nr:unnamed protein product [Pedinophyceae sp. YPF-701]
MYAPGSDSAIKRPSDGLDVEDEELGGPSLLPTSTPQGAWQSSGGGGAGAGQVSGRIETSNEAAHVHESTLDEPVWQTVLRDLKRISTNTKAVLLPGSDRGSSTFMSDWDLWGPLVFTLSLAICLSVGAAKASRVFAMVFVILGLGAVALTANVSLLGGRMAFFQGLCLLGYCLFPLVVAAAISLAVAHWAVRLPIFILAVAWSSWAAVPFVGHSVDERRRALAVYPLFLLYIVIAWMGFVR